MSQSNPMGWARMSGEKAQFNVSAVDEKTLCANLSEIFVSQMGLVKQISLEEDQGSGQKVLQFVLEKGSAIPEQLRVKEIKGIPIRFTQIGDISH